MPTPTQAPCGCSPEAGPACQRHQSSSAGGCGIGGGGPAWTVGCSPWEEVTVGALLLATVVPQPRPIVFLPQTALVSGAAAPTASPTCPACFSHSPDLRWRRQGLRAPLVPWYPAQAAGGAGI